MEETDWDAYGTGNYEKCADCMVHSGYEATAVMDTVRHPLKAAAVALRGVRTEGDMAPEISLDRQRPAEYVLSRHVAEAMDAARPAARSPCSARAGPASADSAVRVSRASPTRLANWRGSRSTEASTRAQLWAFRPRKAGSAPPAATRDEPRRRLRARRRTGCRPRWRCRATMSLSRSTASARVSLHARLFWPLSPEWPRPQAPGLRARRCRGRDRRRGRRNRFSAHQRLSAAITSVETITSPARRSGASAAGNAETDQAIRPPDRALRQAWLCGRDRRRRPPPKSLRRARSSLPPRARRCRA